MARVYKLKLTIFGRLVAGYFIVFLLVIVISFAAVVQMYRFNRQIGETLIRTNEIARWTEGLMERILSERSYETSYVLTGDPKVLSELLALAGDVSSRLEALGAMARSAEEEGLGRRIGELHQRYLGLLRARAAAGAPAPAPGGDRRAQEGRNLLDGMAEALRLFREKSSQAGVVAMREVGSAGLRASNLSIVLSSLALAIGLAVFYLLTRGITRSLSLIKQKTYEIAGGTYGEALSVSSALEIEELAEALNLMAERLKNLEETKKDLFSMMTHELRNPLASIREGTRLLLREYKAALTQEQARLLSIVDEESRRMLDLVNSFLDLSRMEAGMMTYSFETLQVVPLVQRVLAELEPCFAAKGIRVRLDSDQDVPPVEADKERLLQVLRNLIGNAAKFTPKGGRVTVGCARRDSGVEVSVADTGPGIPEEHLGTVFEKYARVTSRGRPQPYGSGLGLAIVKQVVTAHGGRVWAESEPGRGSVFRFSLPASGPGRRPTE
jgi:two-component system sensor histidine kinase GlrK